MLLETHISKDAREKLLAQVAARAQAQVSKVVNSTYVRWSSFDLAS